MTWKLTSVDEDWRKLTRVDENWFHDVLESPEPEKRLSLQPPVIGCGHIFFQSWDYRNWNREGSSYTQEFCAIFVPLLWGSFVALNWVEILNCVCKLVISARFIAQYRRCFQHVWIDANLLYNICRKTCSDNALELQTVVMCNLESRPCVRKIAVLRDKSCKKIVCVKWETIRR